MIWLYYLIVPVSALAVANQFRELFGNPSPIEESFFRIPSEREVAEFPEQGDFLYPASFYLASFPMSDSGRESLAALLANKPSLGEILWVRAWNPQYPDTPEGDRNKIIASNWPAFPPGATCDWTAVTSALSNI